MSDHLGGKNVLSAVFIGVPIFALVLSFQPEMILLTVCFLLIAALLGLGNGAVFKLVAQYFKKEAGIVTGLVGAAGGLGGFFPPLVMGFFKTVLGSYALGYVLLTIVAVSCLLIEWIALRSEKSKLLRAEPLS